MAKRDRTLEALDHLAEAVEDPRSSAADQALRKALRSRTNLIVAAALEVIVEHELAGYEAPMQAAFEAALQDPVRRDPGCRTKMGVVRALDALREPADELFLTGVRTVQAEPVWGGRQDSAAALRGMSAMALVHRHHHRAMFELARLLADPEREARRMAAEAVAQSGDALAGVPLLVLRVRVGDPDPEVLSACFAAMLALDAEGTFALVAEQLRSADELSVEAAALALGQERPDGAFEALRELVETSLHDTRRVALLALAMLRSEEAWDYLFGRIAAGPVALARQALEALSPYREQPRVIEGVHAALARREDDVAELEDALAEHFG